VDQVADKATAASSQAVESGTNWIVTYYGQYYMLYGMVLWFIAGTIAVGLVAYFLAKWFAPLEITPEKRSTYECSEAPIGAAWIRFNIRYYYFALLFLIFDVEVVFLYPWAVVFHVMKTPHMSSLGTPITLGFPILGEMLVFIALLLLGWVYAWRKGYLTWD
jgi:NADH:ubiquinone oxidoreductase subunit 3 (subunit A)